VIDLPDGRLLAWREFGAPDGVPCIYITGTPSSGRAGWLYDEAAREAGVRWISIDKPGYGLSTFHAGRTLRGIAADVALLADHLLLDRFCVAGESGGGPHALAVAHELPHRVTTAIALAGMGPGSERWVRDHMNPLNQVVFRVAHRAPWALGAVMLWMRRALMDDRRAAKFVAAQDRVAPAADRALGESFTLTEKLAAVRDAFRAGTRGATQEMVLMATPWGFRVEDIQVPVEVWHGTEDVNVPLAVAEVVIARLRDCVPHVVEGAGHGVGFMHRRDVMAAVVGAAA